MNTASFWTEAEESTLLYLVSTGATPTQLATALPGRSMKAIRTRRRTLGVGMGHSTAQKPRAPREGRIAALEATVGAAMMERRVDWELVDEYLGGLEYLKGKTAR